MGSGQLPVGGKNAIAPAAAMVPTSQSAIRTRTRTSPQRVISCQPQKATGVSAAIAARPRNCITMSEKIAPG